MARLSRKRISVFLSLLLTAFLFCQGMAQAALLPAMTPPVPAMAMEMPDCHMAPVDTAMVDMKCPTDCQHLDKAYNAEYQASVWSHIPLVALYFLPVLTDETGGPIPLAALPWHDPPADPPIPIRLQRFLK